MSRSLGDPSDYLEHRIPGPDDDQLFDDLINAGLGSRKGSAISDCDGALVRSGRLSLLVSSLAPASPPRMLGFGERATGEKVSGVLPALPGHTERLTLNEIRTPR